MENFYEVPCNIWFCISSHHHRCQQNMTLLFQPWLHCQDTVVRFQVYPLLLFHVTNCQSLCNLRWQHLKISNTMVMILSDNDGVRWFPFRFTCIRWRAMPGNLLVIVIFVVPSWFCLHNVGLICMFAEYLFIFNILVCWPMGDWTPA